MASKFRPKGLVAAERPTGAELTQALAGVTGHLLPTTPSEPARVVTQERAPKPEREPLLLVNFKATRSFAKLLSQLAEKEGGLRRMFARMLAEAGHPVPEADLNPRHPRRRTYE